MIFAKTATRTPAPTATPRPPRPPQRKGPRAAADEQRLALQLARANRQAEHAWQSKLSPFERELLQAWSQDHF